MITSIECAAFSRSPAAAVVFVSRLFQRLVFVLGVAIFAALGLGYGLGEMGWFGVHAGGEQDGAYKQIGVYQQVLRRIQSDYVTEPDMQKVTAGALHGLLESLDPDSSYLTPAEYKIFKDRSSASVGQLGLTISKRYGYATVVNVVPGSPADHEHINDGDVIEALGDQSTREMSLAVIRLELEGKPGTTVNMTLVRPGKPDPDKLTLTRTIVNPPALSEQEYDNNSVLYLKPGVVSKQRVDEIAAQIKASKGRKILLDLRDTSGGDEQQGVRLANLFIKQGTLGMLEGQTVPKQTFTADPSLCITAAPLAVLINRGTFGPAELVAAAVEGAKRGDVVGERTFGEGSVQKTLDLPDGAAVILTVAKYEGPDGNKIQDVAVTPNVLVETAAEENLEVEPQTNKEDLPLQKALEILKAKNG